MVYLWFLNTKTIFVSPLYLSPYIIIYGFMVYYIEKKEKERKERKKGGIKTIKRG